MLDNESFRDLFEQALQIHRAEFRVDNNAIEEAIKVMHSEYGAKEWKDCSVSHSVNYNDPAYRCAYLHKYASCHAALVQKVLLTMLSTDSLMLKNSFMGCDPINICCLGGGPGTDVVGLSSVFCLMDEFQSRSFQFTIVDCMIQWVYALSSVVKVSNSARFGSLGSLVSKCNYLQADMLFHMPESVIEAVSSTDMITMVKFVSAAASQITPKMLKVVFTLLKPGALVLFIDNAAGGFYEMVSEAAYICGLSTECGPFRHIKFEDEVFKRKMFGFFSLSSTTVAVQMWRKNSAVLWNRWESHLTHVNSTSECFGAEARSNLCPTSDHGGPFTHRKKRKRSSRKHPALSNAVLTPPTSQNLKRSQNQPFLDSIQKGFSGPSSYDNASTYTSSIKVTPKADLVSEISQSSYGNAEQSNLKSGPAKSFPCGSSWQPNYPENAPLLKEKASCSSSIEGEIVADIRKSYSGKVKHSNPKSDAITKDPTPFASSWSTAAPKAVPFLKERSSLTSSTRSLSEDGLVKEIHKISHEKLKHNGKKSDTKGFLSTCTSQPVNPKAWYEDKNGVYNAGPTSPSAIESGPAFDVSRRYDAESRAPDLVTDDEIESSCSCCVIC